MPAFSIFRRRRRVLVYQTSPPAAAAASPVQPPRMIVARVIRLRPIAPRVTAIHTPVYNAAHQGARATIVIGRCPQPKRITLPGSFATRSVPPNLPLPNHVLPRPIIVHRLDRLNRSRPIAISAGRATVPPAVMPSPAVVMREQAPRRGSLTRIVKTQSALPLGPLPAITPARVARVPLRRTPPVIVSSCRSPQASRPSQPGLITRIVSRFARRLPASKYVVSTQTAAAPPVGPTRPKVVCAPRQPVRPRVVIQLTSGSGCPAELPLRPLIIRRPPPFRLPATLIKAALSNILASPAQHGPMPRALFFARRPEPLPRHAWRFLRINPPQPIPGVNPPAAGSSTLPPDLIAACIAWLRLSPSIVAAFGDAVGSEKFGSDIASRNTSPPYLEFSEPDEDESYESKDFSGQASSLAQGTFTVDVVGPQSLGKLGTRQLAETVVARLNDAPLTFQDGVLVYLRRSQRNFPTFRVSGPGPNVAAWKRTLEFDYRIDRYVT